MDEATLSVARHSGPQHCSRTVPCTFAAITLERHGTVREGTHHSAKLRQRQRTMEFEDNGRGAEHLPTYAGSL